MQSSSFRRPPSPSDTCAAEGPAAEDLLFRLRWPDGPVCPFCGGRFVYALSGSRNRHNRFKCGGCRRQFTLTKSTILENSRLPLSCWVAAAELLTSRPDPPPLLELERHLGVGRTGARNLLSRLAYAARRLPLEAMLRHDAAGHAVPSFAHLGRDALLAALLATPAPTDRNTHDTNGVTEEPSAP